MQATKHHFVIATGNFLIARAIREPQMQRQLVAFDREHRRIPQELCRTGLGQADKQVRMVTQRIDITTAAALPLQQAVVRARQTQADVVIIEALLQCPFKRHEGGDRIHLAQFLRIGKHRLAIAKAQRAPVTLAAAYHFTPQVTADHFIAQHDQVKPADTLGNTEHLFGRKLRGMNALPGRSIRAQQIPVGHGDFFVRKSLAHVIQRPVLANAAPQFAVIARSDVLQRSPQRHHGAQVVRH
ncbi:hypothetical protein D9M68_756140 [compost metagenome]